MMQIIKKFAHHLLLWLSPAASWDLLYLDFESESKTFRFLDACDPVYSVPI
jgi:hypothetical protein